MDELQRELKELTEPKEPDTYADAPPVVRFVKHFPSSWTKYDYAAIGVRGSWYVTQNGGGNHRSMTWAQLLQFIGEGFWSTLEFLG